MAIREFAPIGQLIYDRVGAPLAYIGDDNGLYRLDGSPVAYVHGAVVWSFPGEPVAWFTRGWLRTLHGCCAGFVRGATAHFGPAKPVLKHPLSILRRQNVRSKGPRKRYPQAPPPKIQWSKAPLDLLLRWIELDAGQ